MGVRDVLGPDVRAVPRSAEHEAAILASPRDPERYARYIQWLRSRDPRRAELFDLEQLVDSGDHDALARYNRLLGDPRVIPQGDGRVQLVCRVRYGFVIEAAIQSHGWPAGPIAERLLSHPAAFALQRLTITGQPETAIAPLIRHRPPLDHLALGDNSAVHIGEIDELLAVLPRLEDLSLFGTLGWHRVAQLPALRTLTLRLDESTLGWLAIVAPQLQSVRLSSAVSLDVVGLLSSIPRIAPDLRELFMMGALATDRTCHALREAPWTARLAALELSPGEITDVGARMLLELPPHAHLSVAGNQIVRPSLLDQLRVHHPAAKVEGQSMPPPIMAWLHAQACGPPGACQFESVHVLRASEHVDGHVELEVRYTFDHDGFSQYDKSETYTGVIKLDAELHPVGGALAIEPEE